MHSARSWTKWIVCTLAVLCASVAPAQTTVAASLYGAFNESTSGNASSNNTKESPANQAGGLIEWRRIKSPLFGYEATYSYNRANEGFSPAGTACGLDCGSETAAVSANAHEFTADWVASVKIAKLRPFALVGGGLLLNVPSSATLTVVSCVQPNPCTQTTGPAQTSNSASGVFVYGGGVDWGLLPHLGLRLQYRGNLYKAPAIVNAFSSTNAFTHTAEPMVGIYFRL